MRLSDIIREANLPDKYPPPPIKAKAVTSHGIEYAIDQYGIHQLNPEPFTYDASYVQTYNTEAYRRGSELLQALRLGFVVGAHGSVPNFLQDHGYGNGDFMLAAKQIVANVSGCDISGVKVPGCVTITDRINADVWTFWDCLEHQHDLSFLKTAPCDTICVSLPWCHDVPGTEFFDDKYKHRKPNEHVHHFNPLTLTAMMNRYGWFAVALSNHEDIIRKSAHGLPNILSMTFKRKWHD